MADYVLIVDDDPDVIRLVMDVLEVFDIEGRAAMDGQEALEAVSAEPPRAMVLDLMMPVMDGYRLIEHLQETAAGRRIPIILLSALADHYDPGLKRMPGVIGVIPKGHFSMDKLRGMLAQALGQQAE